MIQERRPKTKPTEDRKLLQAAPYADTSFLDSDAWRALRIEGEFVEGFDSLARLGRAVTIFGSARTLASDPTYRAAEQLAARFAREGITVITGGGPGIMEAANKGAAEAGGVSVGLGIELPHEQDINKYCTLALNFRYFFVRKTMFVKYAQAFVIFPGGFGTFDELFESLVLVQTGKIDHFPVILFGSSYWKPLIDWLSTAVLEHGMIAPIDLELFRVTDDPEDIVAWVQKSFVDARAAHKAAEASSHDWDHAEAKQERRDQVHPRPE
ncbi:MAG TPA: TIGR00730 family Rossman fold protein [Candidatus Limnocylindrales bacterium]